MMEKSRSSVTSVRFSEGQQISAHRFDLETAVGTSHSIFSLSSRGKKNYLYDQRLREFAYAAQKDHQNTRAFP